MLSELKQLIMTQGETNHVLHDLLDNVRKSNRILMMVNIVNILTIITIFSLIIWG